MLEDPEIDYRAKQAALGELLGDTDELVRNFLLVVVEKGRASELASIYEEFAALVAADEGSSRSSSPRPTSSRTTRRATSSSRSRKRPEEVDATRRVDPNLIGGFVLRRSMRVDASVHGRLERLRQELTKRR